MPEPIVLNRVCCAEKRVAELEAEVAALKAENQGLAECASDWQQLQIQYEKERDELRIRWEGEKAISAAMLELRDTAIKERDQLAAEVEELEMVCARLSAIPK